MAELRVAEKEVGVCRPFFWVGEAPVLAKDLPPLFQRIRGTLHATEVVLEGNPRKVFTITLDNSKKCASLFVRDVLQKVSVEFSSVQAEDDSIAIVKVICANFNREVRRRPTRTLQSKPIASGPFLDLKDPTALFMKISCSSAAKPVGLGPLQIEHSKGLSG